MEYTEGALRLMIAQEDNALIQERAQVVREIAERQRRIDAIDERREALVKASNILEGGLS